MRAIVVLRALLLLLLGVGLLLPEAADDAATAPVRRVGSGVAELRALALLHEPPRLLVRDAAAPPTAAELDLLAGLARRTPLAVALPEAAPALRVGPPSAGQRVGRTGTLRFSVRAEPGDSVMVRLLESGAATDSARVGVGPDGQGQGAFRLRPARSGWHQWTVEGGGTRAAVGGWVGEPRALRVLVTSGPPTWETRFAARALEEAGVEVTAMMPIGRGVAIGGGVPGTAAGFAEFDLAVLFPGAAVDPARLDALERFVADGGGGALVAGMDAALPGLGLAGGERAASVAPAREIAWALPPELVALPDAPVEARVEPLADARPGLLPVASLGGESLLAIRALGRGRAAALGLRETWRWRLESGRVDEHREFWRALAEWLAGGLREPVLIQVSESTGPAGVPVEVTAHAAAFEAPRLTLTRPGGRAEPLTLGPLADELGGWRGTVLPADTGVHTLTVAGDTVVRAAFRATTAGGAASDGWARLSLLAHRSGGAALPRDSVAGWVADRSRGWGGGPARPPWLRGLVIALSAAVALAEWSLRRTRGLP